MCMSLFSEAHRELKLPTIYLCDVIYVGSSTELVNKNRGRVYVYTTTELCIWFDRFWQL